MSPLTSSELGMFFKMQIEKKTSCDVLKHLFVSNDAAFDPASK